MNLGLLRKAFLVLSVLLLACTAQDRTDYSEVVKLRKVMDIGQSALPKGLSFDMIDDISVDGQGNIYVSENSKYHIIKFNKNGKYLLHFGELGQGPGEFMGSVVQLAIDNDNNVYVTDSKNGRVEKYESNGKYLDEYTSFSPLDITLDNESNLYIWPSENRGYMLTRYNCNQDSKEAAYLIKQINKSDELRLEHCILGIKENNLYLVSNLKRFIYIYDLNGKRKAKWKVNDPEFTDNFKGRVKHIRETVKQKRAKVSLNPFVDLAIDPQGNLALLYLWEDFTKDKDGKDRFKPLIYLFTPQGRFLYKLSGIDGPISKISYDEKGSLYAVSIVKSSIEKYVIAEN